MNCAYHADQSAVAYCRTCGKALCANCTRPVRGVIYCEDCLGARMGVSAPASSFAPGAGAAVPPPGAVPPPQYVPPVPTSSGPNPTVAGILAGIFPFGVGAVYTGQYAKGLAHLAIFALLIAGCNASGEVIPAISGIGIAFFVVYQIIDAVRSARAIQAGLPAPDPYGLGATFGGGVKGDGSKVPTGAIVLILLGVLFLLHTAGVFEVGFERIWPVFLMGLGVWLFVRNYGVMGGSLCDPTTRRKRIMGPAMLFTIGGLWFLSTFDRVDLSIGRTWPVILLVIGAIKLFERTGGDTTLPPNPTGGSVPPQDVQPPANPPAPPSTPSEVNHG
jgi:hypothetical protein